MNAVGEMVEVGRALENNDLEKAPSAAKMVGAGRAFGGSALENSGLGDARRREAESERKMNVVGRMIGAGEGFVRDLGEIVSGAHPS